MRPNLIDDAQFRRVLGDELRTARTARGLVRRDIAPRLQPPVSVNTLATYELGTRHIPVTRFVEICLLLDVLPMDILRRAYERVFTDMATGWDVDLAAATNLQDPALAPLAAWAAVRLNLPGQRRVARLDRAAIVPLATLCGLEWHVLVARLPPIPAGSRAPMTEPQPWMKAAAQLAEEARETGDDKGYRRIMDAAEARCERPATADRSPIRPRATDLRRPGLGSANHPGDSQRGRRAVPPPDRVVRTSTGVGPATARVRLPLRPRHNPCRTRADARP